MTAVINTAATAAATTITATATAGRTWKRPFGLSGSSTWASVATTPRLHRQSEAVYRRRRAVVGTALAAFVAICAVAAHDVLAGSGGVPASAAVSLPARSMIVAQPGDTLWSIATIYHGKVSVTHYVDALVDLNGGASIEAGQQIVLP
jgi:hypothetical protein